ncbi:MAG: hypothetical protein M3P11_11145 [Actinomycetota bacterium]|nr:hypothetical protein [Actinomycetota bacterium]
MTERWQTEMKKIGRMEPSLDLLERAEHGPSLPDPGPRPASRVTAALIAIAIAIAGGWMLHAAFSDSVRRQPVGNSATDFTSATWPETSLAEAQQVQVRVDAGDPAVQWRTDGAAVALRFGRVVLGWPNPLAGQTATDDPDTVIVSLHGPDASCQGEACSSPSPQSIVTLTLRRLVRSGEGGIWSVTSLDGEEHVSASTQP